MKKIILAFSLLLISNLQSQQTVSTLKEALQEFKKSPALKGAHLGISIRNLQNGQEVFQWHGQQNFTPASNLKLLYTLAAIDQLGKDFRYDTQLGYSGKIVNNMLFGDLIIKTSGDPSFGSMRMKEDYRQLMEEMLSKLRNLGITTITGQIVMACNGWRYPAPGSWPIEDIGNYYGTGAWDFNFNDNRIDIFLKPGEHIGEPTGLLNTEPEIEGITYINKVLTNAPDSNDEAYIYAAPFDTSRYILGTIPGGKKIFKIKGGIPNPPLSFLKIFKKKLVENHIQVQNIAIRNAYPSEFKQIWHHQSQPLIILAKYTNDFSINHFSEALAWLLINGDKPANGYLNKRAIHDFFAPYGFEAADIEDGSGLAPDNLVQPTQMTAFLKLMTDKLGQSTVLDILPHGGKDGYAKYFLKKHPMQSQVWVKSGSVSKVQNYTGIFKAKSGHYYSFSIMTNYFIGTHKAVKKAIEKLIVAYMSAL